MSSSPSHVGVQPGSGLVARYGTAVVVVDTSTANADQDGFTNALLELLDTAATEQPSPDDFAWQIAQLLVSHHPAAPTFGLVSDIPGAHLLLLHGSVRAVLTTADGDVPVAGRSALTWLDQIVPGPLSRVAISLTVDGPITADTRSDLRGGLVPGGGFVLSTAGTIAPVPAPPVVDVVESAPPEPAAISDPEPIAPEPDPVIADPAPYVADPAPAAVESAATTAMPVYEAPAPQEPAAPQRPDPTVLVADDGTRTPLDRPYVFGREPQYDDAVTSGAATPLPIADPDNQVSRVHAYMWTDDGGVHVRDARSDNGTFVAAPGAPDWTRLGPDPLLLPVGWSLRMGRRVFTHHAPGT